MWEAQDAAGHRVALKLLHPQIANEPMARKRLRREAEIINKVKSRGIAHVLDLEVDSNEPFVVTELIDGPTLAQDVTRNGAWNREDLSDLAEWLRRILTELHASGVVHRDIKPSNIMLSAQGPVLIDFGIAKMATDERMTKTGMVTGTPGYLAPEVIEGEDPGPAADWWAWASVLVFCATGRQPFGSGPLEAVLARVTTGKVDVDGLDDQIRIPLLAALRPDPAQRATPEAVVAGLSADPKEFDAQAYAQTVMVDIPEEPTEVAPVAPSIPPAIAPTAYMPEPEDNRRAGFSGAVAYQDGQQSVYDTQDVELSPPWKERYQPPSVKQAPLTGLIEAIIIAALFMVTSARMVTIWPLIIFTLSIIGSIAIRLNRKRMAQGYKEHGEIAKTLPRLPKYLVRGIGVTLGHIAVGTAVAVLFYLPVSRFMLFDVQWPSLFQALMFPAELTGGQVLTVWAIATVALVIAWWLPAGTTYRHASRYLHDRVIIHPIVRAVVVIIGIIAIVVLAFTLNVTDEISWIYHTIVEHFQAHLDQQNSAMSAEARYAMDRTLVLS